MVSYMLIKCPSHISWSSCRSWSYGLCTWNSYMDATVAGGVPLIGPVPDLQGLFLATGHEGSGLCMVILFWYIVILYSLWLHLILYGEIYFEKRLQVQPMVLKFDLSQTSKVISLALISHSFITSNYNFASMHTKGRVAILIFWLYIIQCKI